MPSNAFDSSMKYLIYYCKYWNWRLCCHVLSITQAKRYLSLLFPRTIRRLYVRSATVSLNRTYQSRPSCFIDRFPQYTPAQRQAFSLIKHPEKKAATLRMLRKRLHPNRDPLLSDIIISRLRQVLIHFIWTNTKKQ